MLLEPASDVEIGAQLDERHFRFVDQSDKGFRGGMGIGQLLGKQKGRTLKELISFLSQIGPGCMLEGDLMEEREFVG